MIDRNRKYQEIYFVSTAATAGGGLIAVRLPVVQSGVQDLDLWF